MKTIKLLGKLALMLIAAILMFSGHEAAAGVTLSMPGVTGTVTTDGVSAKAPELNLDTIVKEIVEVFPARTPLDTLLRKVGRSTKALSWKVEGYEVEQRPFVDTVKTLYTTSVGKKAGKVAVDNIGQWTTDHTVLIQGVKGKEVMVLVTDVNHNTGEVTLTTIDSGTGQPDLPTIPLGTKLTRMGTAMDELQSQVDAYAELPSKDFNYCQKFGQKISMSFVQQMVNQEVKWGFSDTQKMRIKSFREEMELSYLSGLRGVTNRVKNGSLKPVYTMNGVTRHDIKQLTYGTGGNMVINSDTMNGLMKDVFTGNAGSETRIALYGSGMGKNLYGITDWSKIIQGTQTEIIPGLTFGRYEHNYGKLMFNYAPLFDQLGWDNCMLIVDINYLMKATMFDTKIVDLDLEKSGQEDANAKMIKETSTLLTLYPEVHAFIAPKL